MGISVPTKRHLGAIARNRREALGLSMRDLTAMCGVSPATICRLEHGMLPRMENVKSVYLALGLDFSRAMVAGLEGVQLELKGIRKT